jgi:hypothetical protein
VEGAPLAGYSTPVTRLLPEPSGIDLTLIDAFLALTPI